MRRKPLIAALVATVSTAIVLIAAGAARPAAEPDRGALDAAPASPVILDDATIVAIFDAANTADIETGQLAAQRGHSKAVRDFGVMLARDHQIVRQQGRDLATKLRVTPTPPADDPGAKAHAEAMATLRSKEGAEFDRAFLAHEVAFHKSVIDAVKSTLLPAIGNAELKKLVVTVAPAFEAHMIAAKNLQGTVSTGSPE